MTIKKEFLLSQILWYKIGGVAKFLIEVNTAADVLEAVEFVQKNKVKKIFVLGWGSNLLFSDQYFDGAIIHFIPSTKPSLTLKDEVIVEAFGGESLDSVIQFALQNNLVGLEWAGGLPGTVGAAVRGNVGAFGGEIKDVIKSAQILSQQEKEILQPIILRNEQLNFSYRSSIVKKEKSIVISANFELKKGNEQEVEKAWNTYKENIAYRKSHHPLDYPNCGSVFKNIHDASQVAKVLGVYPELDGTIKTRWHGKVSMGYLIGKLGLTGFTIGKAQISEKHQNFIINLGGATFLDVVTIIRTVQEKIRNVFDFTPEVEVEIVE